MALAVLFLPIAMEEHAHPWCLSAYSQGVGPRPRKWAGIRWDDEESIKGPASCSERPHLDLGSRSTRARVQTWAGFFDG